jgi:hypothetical protein
MSDPNDFEDVDGIKNLFKQILGTEVIIKDNLDSTEETVFTVLVNKLEESQLIENKLFNEGGVELNQITDPLWFVLENTFKLLYGIEATDLILWYIYDRFDSEGKLIPIPDEEEELILKTTSDLWDYIKTNYKIK